MGSWECGARPSCECHTRPSSPTHEPPPPPWLPSLQAPNQTGSSERDHQYKPPAEKGADARLHALVVGMVVVAVVVAVVVVVVVVVVVRRHGFRP